MINRILSPSLSFYVRFLQHIQGIDLRFRTDTSHNQTMQSNRDIFETSQSLQANSFNTFEKTEEKAHCFKPRTISVSNRSTNKRKRTSRNDSCEQ